MTESDADTIHISPAGKTTLTVQPVPFLNERAIQHFFSSLDEKTLHMKEHKVFEDGYFFTA